MVDQMDAPRAPETPDEAESGSGTNESRTAAWIAQLQAMIDNVATAAAPTRPGLVRARGRRSAARHVTSSARRALAPTGGSSMPDQPPPDQPRPDRPRYYLTTSIAYANNKPGLHTLFEVIGADAIARWHRMKGNETRFLTGTDEYSVNIALTAAEQGRDPKAFVDAMVALFRTAADTLQLSPDRFIRTTDLDHQRAVHEMIRRAYASGDLYVGNYEGWYCPNEGFIPASQLVEDSSGIHCANHPTVALQWLSERNWFFRLSAYQEKLARYYADHPDSLQTDDRNNDRPGLIPGAAQH